MRKNNNQVPIRNRERAKIRIALGCLYWFAAIGIAFPSTSPAVTTKPKILRGNIIVLQSYHAGLSWSDSVMRGIQDTLAENKANIQISGEYLDARRVIEPILADQIRDLLERKLKTMSADLILCVDNAALDFMLKRRKTLFPETPIVFCGINDFLPARIAPYRRITGIAEDLSVVDTVNLAIRLHPGLNEIIVIGRTTVTPDQANRASFVAALPRLPKTLKITFWDDLPTPELKARLTTLPPNSAVFINGLIADSAGRQLMYAQTTEWICGLTAVPVYSLWEVYFGYGIVGGKLTSGYQQGRMAADYALRILKGKNPDDLPVVRGQDANRYMLDYRQLVRFGISMSKLPPNSQIFFIPETFYHTHKRLVWSVTGAFVVLTGLVILLSMTTIRLRKTQEALRKNQKMIETLNKNLETRVLQRTTQLETANKELEAFSYSVSHDLRSPLRGINGFSQILLEKYQSRLDEDGNDYLMRIVAATRQMGQLIDDLLQLSRIARSEINKEPVNLSSLVQELTRDITESNSSRHVEFDITPGLMDQADPNLIRIVLDNLLRNAWKFTANRSLARIEFADIRREGKRVYLIRDNGAGFDMKYADKLFLPFQRLHNPSKFEGTGIGLTIVQRIVTRHGGQIWAEAQEDQGATFFFTLS